jgi:hypothetical protein
MLQKTYRIFIILLLLSSIVGCIKEEVNPNVLDIHSEKMYDIVIEGFISTETTFCQIKLSKPMGISSSNFEPINNASVKITDGNLLHNFELTSVPGVFQSIDSISGELEKKYTLIVEYNNKTYYASDSLVQCNPLIDFPIDEIKIFDSHIQSSIRVHNFGYNNASIWNFVESTDEEGRIIHYDIKELHNLNIYNHIGSIPQGIFPAGFTSTGASGFATDSLEIIKLSVSEAYYNYLLSQFNISEWSSGIFSTIPGNTKTNVSDGGTGYFYCTDVKRFRTTYKDFKTIIE